MVSWSGKYQDRHGTEQVRIDNDGRLLTVAIRGVQFAGEDFDALAPIGGCPASDLAFTLSDGCLCSCVLEWDAPLPVVAGFTETEGLLRCRLILGDSGGLYGGLTAEEPFTRQRRSTRPSATTAPSRMPWRTSIDSCLRTRTSRPALRARGRTTGQQEPG
jgi:Family of unknown function (DUF6304)